MKFFLSTCLFMSLAHGLEANAQSETWVAQAEAYVKTMSRSVDLYTWAQRKYWGSKPGENVMPGDSRVGAWLADDADSFFDPNAKLNYEGPNGIYLATGPFVSREWGSGQQQIFSGGREWSVIRVTLPVGSRFFDGRMSNSFPPALRQYLSQFGCGANSMRELFNVKARADKAQCWQAYTKMAKVMNIQAVAKYFYSVGPSYCHNHNTHITDFIVIDRKVVGNFGAYVAEIPANDATNEERFFIRDFMLLAKKHVTATCGGTQPVATWWDRFSGTPCQFYVTSPNQYEALWNLPEGDINSPHLRKKMEEKIYGCGNYREDVP